MSTPATWMPEESLRQERAVRPVARVLDEWSAAWLCGPRCEIAGTWGLQDERDDAGNPLRDSGSWIVLGYKGSVVQIACAMLGEPERSDFTPADLRLLRRVAGEALDDLGERLEVISRTHATGSIGTSEERWALKVSLSAAPCFELTIDRALLNRLSRSTYRPEASAGSLTRATAALDEVVVPVTAHLGSAVLELGQLANLEPGDILLLDQVVEEPVPLVIADRKSPLRCAVDHSHQEFTLTLCDPE